MADKCILFVREPTPAELRANGGRLLVSLALRDLANEDYDAYKKTNHWQEVRRKVFRVYGRRCTLGVNCSGPLDVHHRLYDSLGDELMEHMEVLCRKHHIMKHETERAFVRAQAEKQFRNTDDESFRTP